MKNKLVLSLVFIIMLAAFTGCEAEAPLPELTIPERMSLVREFNNDLFSLIVPLVEDAEPTDFTEGDLVTVDEEITCVVTASDVDEINLFMTLDGWVAADGTEISGTISIDVEYYTSPEVSLNIVRTGDPANLYFDRSSVTYRADFVDYNSSDPAFISNYDYFFCYSLLVDGVTLLSNSMIYR